MAPAISTKAKIGLPSPTGALAPQTGSLACAMSGAVEDMKSTGMKLKRGSLVCNACQGRAWRKGRSHSKNSKYTNHDQLPMVKDGLNYLNVNDFNFPLAAFSPQVCLPSRGANRNSHGEQEETVARVDC